MELETKRIMYGLYCIYHEPGSDKKLLIAYGTDVSSFSYFTRSAIKEMMLFSCRETVDLLKQEQGYALEMEDKVCYARKTDRDMGLFAICHNSLAEEVAFNLLRQFDSIVWELLMETKIHPKQIKKDLKMKHAKFKELLVIGNSYHKQQLGKQLTQKEKFVMDQARERDVSIQGLNRKVDENKQLVRENMLKLLENNNDIDQLIEASEDLQTNTKRFYKKSKQMNGCSC